MTKRLRLKTGIRRLILSLWLCMICVTMYPQSTLLVQRNSLQDGGTCGLVDNLTHTYNGTKLIKISDRHIGLIEYDSFNSPRLTQFTDGSVTEYVYDASGVKLKTLHRTAVPGIEVPYGTVYEHTASTVLSSDSTLYAGPFVLSGDSLRYKYDGGSVLIPLDGSPVKPTFYALDHLGSVRLVVSADGQVIERNDYYPSGCLITENIDGETVILPYKYNGKELDPMHGLYTYDYGARQYDPATMLWDRMDPLCEDNPEVSPYVFCHNNPVNAIDPNGMDDYQINQLGYIKFWRRTNAKSTHRIFSGKYNITVGSSLVNQLVRNQSIQGTSATISDSDDAFKFFKFVAVHTKVEWSLVGVKTSSGNIFKLRTDFDTESVGNDAQNNKSMLFHLHSHPWGSNPSGTKASGNYKEYQEIAPGKKVIILDSDIWTLNNIYNDYQKAHPNYGSSRYPKAYIYYPGDKKQKSQLYQYDLSSPKFNTLFTPNYIQILNKIYRQ